MGPRWVLEVSRGQNERPGVGGAAERLVGPGVGRGVVTENEEGPLGPHCSLCNFIGAQYVVTICILCV